MGINGLTHLIIVTVHECVIDDEVAHGELHKIHITVVCSVLGLNIRATR